VSAGVYIFILRGRETLFVLLITYICSAQVSRHLQRGCRFRWMRIQGRGIFGDRGWCTACCMVQNRWSWSESCGCM